MKIAFVSQPIDTIFPPYQNSVGACTYWVARLLAQSAEVVVYGLTDNHEDFTPTAEDSGIDYRFFPATRGDKRIHAMQRRLAKFFRRSSPISTSRWWYPGYGAASRRGSEQTKLRRDSFAALFTVRTRDPRA